MAKSFIVTANREDFNKNTIVDEKNVLVRITDWDFKTDDPQTIVLMVKILSGSRKGIEIKDFVTFNPNDKMNWKYAALRAAIGEPIPEKGTDQFDLLNLVNRKIAVNLVKSKDGKFQNFTCIPYNEKLVEELAEKNPEQPEPEKKKMKAPEEAPVIEEQMPAPAPAPKAGGDTLSIVDDDLPF